MNIQVLVASMNQEGYSLLEKMNIKSDAIIGNQCGKNSIEEFNWKNYKIKYLNFAEKGVGLNRNNALMRATGEYCLFADDDMVYEDDYVEKVEKAFQNLKDADVIIFNLKEENPTRFIIKKITKVNYFNYLRYGTARIAVKLESIRENGIFFNQCFGGGAKYCHGEDNLFLTDCLKKELKIYAVPEYIATLTEERDSSWNHGYDEKYLKDQGRLYYAISKKYWKLLCLQDIIRRRKEYKTTIVNAYKKMISFKK